MNMRHSASLRDIPAKGASLVWISIFETGYLRCVTFGIYDTITIFNGIFQLSYNCVLVCSTGDGFQNPQWVSGELLVMDKGFSFQLGLLFCVSGSEEPFSDTMVPLCEAKLPSPSDMLVGQQVRGQGIDDDMFDNSE